jgi:hypothetical protein
MSATVLMSKGTMNIFRRVAQMLQVTRTLHDASDAGKRTPVRKSDDWRQARLAEAAQKYGKPFKCASDDMPREVIVGGKHLVAVPSGRGATRRLDKMSD